MSQPNHHRRNWILSAAGIAVSIGTAGVNAQAPKYPQRPIRVIVPFPPGGAIDVMARKVAEGLARELGQSMVVENKPGAAGNIGAQQVAKSPADGYTLLVGTSATHAANPALFSKLPYDPVADFEPVSLFGQVPNVLVVNAASGPKSLADLIAAARREPGKYTYGSAGVGTSLHLGGVLFERVGKVQFTHVAYKGGAPASADLLGGSITMMFDTVAVSLPNLRAGKLKAFAVAARERHFAIPDVPTFAELGFAGVESGTWAGLFAPHGTPAAIVDDLGAAVARVLMDPGVQDGLRANGVQVTSLQGERFRSFVKDEIRHWGEVVREARVALD